MIQGLVLKLVCQLGWTCSSDPLSVPWLLPQSVLNKHQAPIATAKKVSGTVLVKRFDDTSWLKITTNEKLFFGDSLQTLEDSKIDVVYLDNGATLSMTQSSYYKLEANTPGYSRFKKNKGFSNAKLKSTTDTTILSSSANKSAEKADTIKSEIFGMTLQREVIEFKVTDPIGNLVVLSNKIPLNMAVTLEPKLSQTKLWAFLWNDTTPRNKPIWTGFSLGSFAAIPVKKHGDYILQIIAEDESGSSRPIKVKIAKKNGRWMNALESTNSQFPIVLEVR